MAPAIENLYRANNELTLVESETGGMPTMRGHFAVWDQWTEIRSVHENRGKAFLERFAPSSMHKTLRESGAGMKVMFNHGKDPAIGEKLLGVPSRTEPDGHGAAYEVPLFDTSYNRDLAPGLKAGVYGASFRFSVEQQDYDERPKRSEYNPLGIPERTVTEARVFEFGPVSWPAYAGATAGLRSLTDDFLIANFLADDETVERLAQAVADKSRVSVYFGNANTTTTSSSAGNYMTTLEVMDLTADDLAPEGRNTDLEPELPEVTTPSPGETEPDGVRDEPEPSEATTPLTDRGLFWFADTSKLKGANK